MKRVSFLLVIAGACLVLAGCVIMPSGAEYTYQKQPPVMTADDSSGLVYFLRQSAFTGGGAGYFIQEDGKKIGLLASGSYFIHKSVPGKHIYLAGDDASSTVVLDISPGQTYYMLTWMTLPGLIGAPNLHLKEIPHSVAGNILPALKYLHLLN